MNRSPAFQYYPQKWDAHTGHLGDESYRVYHQIINWMWNHSGDYCSITTDPRTLANLLRMPMEKVDRAMLEIQNPALPLLKVKGEKYVNKGLQKEREKQRQKSKKARSSAKVRWQHRLTGKGTLSERIANAWSEQCSIFIHLSVYSEFKTESWLSAWLDYLSHRNDIGKPVTPKAAEGMFKKFKAWGVSGSVASMRKSIENGWTGVFEQNGYNRPESKGQCI